MHQVLGREMTQTRTLPSRQSQSGEGTPGGREVHRGGPSLSGKEGVGWEGGFVLGRGPSTGKG